jgi:hypothetical protein
MSQFLTIVIPTRNRGHTIRDTLQSCVTQRGDCEFLVSDNCSEDDTEEVVRSFSDPRIRLIRTPRVLSMEASFDFALAHAREGYIYAIGADDGLMPDAVITLQKVAAETQAMAIRPLLISYYWDNYPDTYYQQVAQGVPLGEGWRWMESAPFLEEISRDLLQYARFYHFIPSLYHGCVHTSVLSSTWPPAQPLVRSKQPDMYTGILVAASLPRYVVLDKPVSLNAMSMSSNAVPQFLRQNLEAGDGRMFWEEVDYPFEPELTQNSSSPDLCLALPVLLADQFLKVKRLGLNAPSVDMRHVVEATILGALRWGAADRHAGALNVAREVAAIHEMSPLAEELIKQHPFEARTRSRPPTVFDHAAKRYQAVDLRHMGATGPYSASLALVALRDIHVQQDRAKAGLGLACMFPKLATSLSDSRELLAWLMVRATDVPLKGKVLVLQESCDASLQAALLTAPSRAVEVVVSALNAVPATAMFDSILLVERAGGPRREEWREGLIPKLNVGGCLSVVTRQQSQAFTLDGDGLEISSAPLMLTNEESMLLFLREWLGAHPSGSFKKRLLSVIALPLAALLTIRLRKERAKSWPSGWFVERWSVK